MLLREGRDIASYKRGLPDVLELFCWIRVGFPKTHLRRFTKGGLSVYKRTLLPFLSPIFLQLFS
jgi:hypothetical protein